MKKILFVIKNIFKYWYWQDIEKPNNFIRFINLGFSLFLSFCLISWMYGEQWNILLRLLICIYGSSCFLSFWPVSYLLDQKDRLKGTIFYTAQNFFILFSIIILILYILKKYNICKCQ